MKIDFLEPSAGFQTSVNIGYDLNNSEKVKSYIPTSNAVSLLETILLSTADTSTDRAHVLVGAYGKGKSHIVLSILHMLNHKDRDAVAALLEKAKESKPQLYEYATSYLESEKRLLPVVISGNSTSLTQAFQRALFLTLKEHNWTDILPETNSQMALRVIDQWEKEFPAVYGHLQELLPMPINEFEKKLNDFDADAYATFEELYPRLTAGNKFNPFTGYDVVELYDAVCKKLPEKKYSGLFVVYDEFSKYLESSIDKASINDVKLLQDFAEKCCRSGASQLHVLLISHKEIENYIDVLPKQKVDGWRGVSERFSHITMQADYPQTYELLGAAIRKNAERWSDFKADFGDRFTALTDRYRKSPAFADCTERQLQDAIVECYPLHPITTILLPRISEKVAQNERTLFTFVAGRDSTSLPNLKIESENGIPFITPDYLYDYFAPQMQKEVFTSEIHQLYTLTNEILHQLSETPLEAKIVKTICLIYCVGQYNALPPTVETIIDAFSGDGFSQEAIRSAIDSLIQKRLVVYLKRSNAYLQLKRSSGIDVYAEIRNTAEKRKTVIRPADVLNAANVEPYLYPLRYNDEHTMTRYFHFRFMDAADLALNGPVVDGGADGLIIGVVPDASMEENSAELLGQRFANEKQIVLAFPDDVKDIEDELRMFDAVELLRANCADDEALQSEYDLIYQDLFEVINRYVAGYIHPGLHAAHYRYGGKKQQIYRKAHLTELLSSICAEIYPNTPAINNEVINRNTLTTVALNSRTKLLGAILQKNLPENLGLSGSGQDVSFMRSTLIVPGLLRQDENGCTITEQSTDQRLTDLLKHISEFLERSKTIGPLCFGELYEQLIGTTEGIGVRKGLVPIYLAVCLRKYNDHFVIRNHQEEVKMTPALLNQINEAPEAYSVQIEEWTNEKASYTEGLTDVFQDFIRESEKQFGTYSYIMMAMNRWYLSLPKYVKETKKQYVGGTLTAIPKSYSSFLNLLKQSSIGAQELLFTRVPKCFAVDGISHELLGRVKEAKSFYDSVKEGLESELIRITISTFGGNKETGLAATVLQWAETLSDQAKNKLYSEGAERIIPVLSSPGNDEHELINHLAKAVTGLRIEDWNDSTIENFISRLEQYKAAIDHENALNGDSAETDSEGISDHYSVVFIDDEGNTKQRTFARVQCSKRTNILRNRINSDLSDMGHSISQEEKRQILMEILETLC